MSLFVCGWIARSCAQESHLNEHFLEVGVLGFTSQFHPRLPRGEGPDVVLDLLPATHQRLEVVDLGRFQARERGEPMKREQLVQATVMLCKQVAQRQNMKADTYKYRNKHKNTKTCITLIHKCIYTYNTLIHTYTQTSTHTTPPASQSQRPHPTQDRGESASAGRGTPHSRTHHQQGCGYE